MKEAHPRMKWHWWLQINSRNSVLSVENTDTRERIVGKIKTTTTKDKTRTTMAETRTTKTITEIQEISRATMEHQDTPIIFSATSARRTECANTATDIDNIIVSDKISPYQAFHRSAPKIIKKLQVLGEMGVIKNHSIKFQSKLHDKGSVVMFVGYAKDHSDDVRSLKMGTKKKDRKSVV